MAKIGEMEYYISRIRHKQDIIFNFLPIFRKIMELLRKRGIDLPKDIKKQIERFVKEVKAERKGKANKRANPK